MSYFKKKVVHAWISKSVFAVTCPPQCMIAYSFLKISAQDCSPPPEVRNDSSDIGRVKAEITSWSKLLSYGWAQHLCSFQPKGNHDPHLYTQDEGPSNWFSNPDQHPLPSVHGQRYKMTKPGPSGQPFLVVVDQSWKVKWKLSTELFGCAC